MTGVPSVVLTSVYLGRKSQKEGEPVATTTLTTPLVREKKRCERSQPKILWWEDKEWGRGTGAEVTRSNREK